MSRRKLGDDEKALFFAVKIVAPVLVGLIVAAGIDIASVKNGAGGFFSEAKQAYAEQSPSSY